MFSTDSTPLRITEQRDALGRSTGYTYAKNNIPQQQTSISYGTDGRITSAGFTHQGENKQFTYTYLPANRLNQYTAEGSFTPTFDTDGNQTLIKTSTGIWNVTYNAKNRPVLFTKSDGSVGEHRRFLYLG